MRIRVGLAWLWLGIHVGSPALACAGISDDRLLATMSRIAVVVESAHLHAGEAAPNLSDWRASIARRDPEMLQMACQILTEYPSLDGLVAETEQALASSTGLRTPAGGPQGICLSEGEFLANRTILFFLEVGALVVEGYCRSTSCVPGECVLPCTLLPVFTSAMVPIEAILATDAYTCLADHIGDMNTWADFSLGVRLKAGNSLSLTELGELSSQTLLPLMEQTRSGLGRREDFSDAEARLAQALDSAQASVDQMCGELVVEGERRISFQAHLDALQIQRLLGDPGPRLPLLLTLPMANGGRLEAMREVVADAINGSQSIGLPLGQALERLREGDAHYAAARFAPAADAYRNAYLELLP